MICNRTLGKLCMCNTSTTISLKGGFLRHFHNSYELPSLLSSVLSFLPPPQSEGFPPPVPHSAQGAMKPDHREHTHTQPQLTRRRTTPPPLPVTRAGPQNGARTQSA